MLIKVVSVVNPCDIDVAPINYVSSCAKDGNNFVSLALLVIDLWLVVFSSKCEDLQMINITECSNAQSQAPSYTLTGQNLLY